MKVVGNKLSDINFRKTFYFVPTKKSLSLVAMLLTAAEYREGTTPEKLFSRNSNQIT